MTDDEVIDQLLSLRKNSLDFAKSAEEDGETDSIWHCDIEALDRAIAVIKKFNERTENKER